MVFSRNLIAGLLVIFISLGSGCSKSDEQKKFEEHAFATPEQITEMPSDPRQGVISEDPDDWRISPMYQGLIDVSIPAYPNPVSVNSLLQIELYIRGIESIPGLDIFVFQTPDRLVGPVDTYDQSSLNPGTLSVRLDPSGFSNTGTLQGAIGLHRILIFDGRENLITYGDVRVEG